MTQTGAKELQNQRQPDGMRWEPTCDGTRREPTCTSLSGCGHYPCCCPVTASLFGLGPGMEACSMPKCRWHKLGLASREDTGTPSKCSKTSPPHRTERRR